MNFKESTAIIIALMVVFITLGVAFVIMSPVREIGQPSNFPPIEFYRGLIFLILICTVIVITWIIKQNKEDDKHD